MYSFSNWCFLCARDNCVDISIQSLPVKMQEKIGEYSLVVSKKLISLKITLLIAILHFYRTIICLDVQKTFVLSATSSWLMLNDTQSDMNLLKNV